MPRENVIDALHEALEADAASEKNYHVRQALQLLGLVYEAE